MAYPSFRTELTQTVLLLKKQMIDCDIEIVKAFAAGEKKQPSPSPLSTLIKLANSF